MSLILSWFLLFLPPDDADVTHRYLRMGGAGKFVLESRVTETTTRDGVRYVSLTDRGSEKMTLSLQFAKGHQLREAEVVQETAKGKFSARVSFQAKEATLTRGKDNQKLDVAPDVVVTTAPDWSDIFQVVRRYDQDKGGKQEFAGLWIHPVQDTRQLKFTIERLKDVDVGEGDKKLSLKHYRVSLRSGAYLVWADARGRVLRLMPPGRPAGVVVLEGYEKTLSELR